MILLHGYAQNSHMWRPVMKELAKTHLVVAPYLRGFGDSTKAESGYDKKTMAQDVHALANSLNIRKAGVAGHDIGLMVAYAYAAQYPGEVDRLALLDAFIPGVGDTTGLFLLKDLWHFHFYGPTPVALVKGRETDLLLSISGTISPRTERSPSRRHIRRFYAQKYAQPGRRRQAWRFFGTSIRTPRTTPSSQRPNSRCPGWSRAARNLRRRFPHSPGETGCDQCRGRAGAWIGTLAGR